jgi:hypothetical protein
MSTRLRRLAAPLLVIAGAALFGLGAGGIVRVDAELEAATPPATQPAAQQQRAVPLMVGDHRDTRANRPRPHRQAF